MDRAKLQSELIHDEGFKTVSYQDTVGLWTIGVGHLLGKERRVQELTRDECMAFLMMDVDLAILRARQIIGDLVFEELDEVRKRVIVNMAFNLGGRLAGFKKFIFALQMKQWPEAAKEMMDSKWATQVGARATRLRDMILNGKDR